MLYGEPDGIGETYFVTVDGQLMEVVLDLGADGLGGKEQDLLVLVGVENLIGDVPGVHGLLEVVEPLFG